MANWQEVCVLNQSTIPFGNDGFVYLDCITQMSIDAGRYANDGVLTWVDLDLVVEPSGPAIDPDLVEDSVGSSSGLVNFTSIICAGEITSTDNIASCETGWSIQPVVLPFNTSQIDPIVATQLYVGGFFLILPMWVASFGLSQILKTIKGRYY